MVDRRLAMSLLQNGLECSLVESDSAEAALDDTAQWVKNEGLRAA